MRRVNSAGLMAKEPRAPVRLLLVLGRAARHWIVADSIAGIDAAFEQARRRCKRRLRLPGGVA